jgi:hypothetical protein
MRILSVLGMVFLPISTVSSVFGTQFFTSVVLGDSFREGRNGTPEFVVNHKFYILWAIAIPLTSLIVIGWAIWDNWDEIHAQAASFRNLSRMSKPQNSSQLPDPEAMKSANLENWTSVEFQIHTESQT